MEYRAMQYKQNLPGKTDFGGFLTWLFIVEGRVTQNIEVLLLRI